MKQILILLLIVLFTSCTRYYGITNPRPAKIHLDGRERVHKTRYIHEGNGRVRARFQSWGG